MLLHTDALTEKYGRIHAIVLRHDVVSETVGTDRIRETELVDEKGITRTYALVFLDGPVVNAKIEMVDRDIQAGGMIGEIFRKHGYVVSRKTIDAFVLTLPFWLRHDFQTTDHTAAGKLIAFYAQKDSQQPILYGTILEIYSPDFINPATYEISKEHTSEWHNKIEDYFARKVKR